MKSDEDDWEKLEFYLESTFIRKLGFILSTARRIPPDSTLKKMSEEDKRSDIERLHNHIHLSFVTSDIEKQREIAPKIWRNWREKLAELFPDEEFSFEILDGKYDVVVYAFREDPLEECGGV